MKNEFTTPFNFCFIQLSKFHLKLLTLSETKTKHTDTIVYMAKLWETKTYLQFGLVLMKTRMELPRPSSLYGGTRKWLDREQLFLRV